MSAAAAADAITFLWNTPVYFEHFNLRSDSESLTNGDSIDAGTEQQINEWIRSKLKGNDITSPLLRRQFWPHGYSSPIGYGSGTWQAWIFLDEPPQELPDSGAVYLLDPRAGSAAVSVPALPWGRPITFRASKGAAVLCPGWVAWSILTVVHQQGLNVIRADL
jgi:hypothetical protein